jgi:hypothetical protein
MGVGKSGRRWTVGEVAAKKGRKSAPTSYVYEQTKHNNKVNPENQKRNRKTVQNPLEPPSL